MIGWAGLYTIECTRWLCRTYTYRRWYVPLPLLRLLIFPRLLAALYLYKKAQILTYHVWMFFKDQDPARFNFTDIGDLTIFSDNVIPTMLEHFKVIRLPEQLQKRITDGQELSTQEAYLVRAAAVVACERIVQKAHNQGTFPSMTEGGLDVYLWRLGKEGDYRKIVRLQFQDTVMF